MRVTKRVQGQNITLELEKIKDYPRFSEYQVYKIVGTERIPVYKTCLSDFQIKEIVVNKYVMAEDIPTDSEVE